MEPLIFHVLPEKESEDRILASLHLPQDTDPEDLAQARAQIQTAAALADPKALLCTAQVQEHGNDYVVLNGVRIDCALMAKNLRGVYRVFPYVCTCGRELEDWSRTLSDPLLAYWADAVKLYSVSSVQRQLFQYVREHEMPAGHLSHMNPGSLPQWPLSQQRVLFSLLGDVTGTIGVELTESCLMIPAKSTSGILFDSDTKYNNCRFCPMENCPGRSAPFSGLPD